MRFRLNTQGGAGDGFGRGFSSLFQAPINEALAGEQAQDSAVKRQLTSAQIAAHVAQAAHSNAQADLTRTEATSLQGAPDVLDRVIASRSGVDVPTVASWRNQISTGKAPAATVPGDPTADAPVQPAQVTLPGLDPQVMQRIGTEYSRLSPALINPSKFKVDDLAQASGAYQKQDAVDKIVAAGAAGAPGMAALFGQGFAASEGKPLVDNVGNTGRSMNKFTGQGGTIDPGLSALYDKGELAQVQQRQAAAGASNASADHSRASTRKVGAEIDQLQNAPKGVLQQTDQGLLLVDPRTGKATPVLGPDGTTAGKAGLNAKALPSSAAKGLLENQASLRNAEQALAMLGGNTVSGIAGDSAATGVKGYLPGKVLDTVDPSGVDTRAALANLSSLVIHDRSGAAVSASEFPRLRPFVPLVTDSPATAKKKLAQFVNNYRAIVDDQTNFYRESGYAVPSEVLKQVEVTPPAGAPATPAAGAAPAGPKVTNW